MDKFTKARLFITFLLLSCITTIGIAISIRIPVAPKEIKMKQEIKVIERDYKKEFLDSVEKMKKEQREEENRILKEWGYPPSTRK